MEFRLLGPLEAVGPGGPVPIRGAKQRALLAALLVHRGEVMSADRLIDLLWPDGQPANPANALQAQVSQLRKALPEGDVLVTREAGYVVDVPADRLDSGRFEQLVVEGRRFLEAGDADRAATTLAKALELWRGPALADFVYDEFARPTIARLEESRLEAVELRIEADLAAGHHAELVGELEALCAAHPLRERLWAHRMTALYRCGRQADALRAYADARGHLVEELGIEPGPELRRLEQLVLEQSPELDAPAVVRAAPKRQGNLRARLTRFVGRVAECREVATLLESSRLVTLVGPGGSGKTRLAVEVAANVADGFEDGAWLVELAGVADPAGVAPAVAGALGLSDATSPRTVAMANPVVEQLAAHLAGQALLVVLDNCEHVVDEAASVVEHLLGAVPGLRVVATSREGLGIPGEVIRSLAPLDLDTAIALFFDRAAAVSPEFHDDECTRPVVADICLRLDGLPLAVELAAARLRALPLEQVAARLDDRFRLLTGGSRTALPRQQTLRAVVDWSHDLLFEDERRLFARLSAFPGGCTLEAAEAVCGDELLPVDAVLDLLDRLVAKSLVTVDRHDGVRYAQLQTLWHYARERLVESGEAAMVRDRHAAWFRAVAEGAGEGLRGESGPAWRSRLAAELDNLRAALDWSIERGDAESALRIVSGMAWFWFLRAEWHEAVRWLGDALAAPGEAHELTRGRAAAWFAYFAAVIEGPSSHVGTAKEAFDAVSVAGAAGGELGEAALLYASTLNRAGEYLTALSVLELAHEALAPVGHQWGLAMHDVLCSHSFMRLGRFDEAEAAAQAAADRFEAIGERWALIEPLGYIAAVHEVRGDLEGAIAAYERVIGIGERFDLPAYRLFWTVWLAAARARQGDDERAAAGFAEVGEASRNPVVTAFALIGGAHAARRLGDRARARDNLHAALALFDGLERPDGQAAAWSGLALCAVDDGDVDEARALAARADGVLVGAGALASAAVAEAGGDRAEAARLVAEVRRTRGPVVPGSFVTLEVPDLDRLATRLGL